jgi:hypothetical protein
VLGGAVLHHGCLLVRGLMGTERVQQLRADIDRAFSARADGRDEPGWYEAFEPDTDAALLAARRKWVEDCGAMWAADSPPALLDILDALDAVALPDVIGGYLGEPPLLSVNKCTLRRVSPGTFPSWHQDGAFLGEQVRTIDVWVAFTDCGAGTDAPGLSVVPRRVDHLLPRGTGSALVADGIDHEEVLRTLQGEQPLTPHFAAGDALLFDGLFVHCTGAQPGQTDIREALEAWFFTPSTFPQGYVPLAL